MAMSLAAPCRTAPTVGVLGSKRASATRRGLTVSKTPARVARGNVTTTRAILEVGQADFKAEVLEVSNNIPPPRALTAGRRSFDHSSRETEIYPTVREHCHT